MIAIVAFLFFLSIISLIDLFTKTIHDFWLILGALVCYPLLVFFGGGNMMDIFVGVIWGIGSYGVIYFVTRFIYGEEVFGQGDVLFNGFISGFLGLIPSVISTFLTFFVSLVFVIIAMAVHRKDFMKSEIPLAPSMAISAAVSLFYHEAIIELLFGI